MWENHVYEKSHVLRIWVVMWQCFHFPVTPYRCWVIKGINSESAKNKNIMIMDFTSCPSWQWHRAGSSWSPVQTLPVAPLWCDLGFFQNSSGNKAAANLSPLNTQSCPKLAKRCTLMSNWISARGRCSLFSHCILKKKTIRVNCAHWSPIINHW